VTSEPFTILVVCLGNVCRSPLAERLLRLRFEQLLEDRPVSVTSAGVLALVGNAMDRSSAEQLMRLGGDPAGFVSRQVDAPLLEGADLVLTATRELRSQVLELAPRALRHTFTIRELAQLVSSPEVARPPGSGPAELVARAASWRSADIDAFDVPDPIGQPPAFHREVADLLDETCTAIAEAIAASMPPEARSA
jgi:low molecular weight protein-tyrosine phosphatase